MTAPDPALLAYLAALPEAAPILERIRGKLGPRRPSVTLSPRIVGPDGSHRIHVTLGRPTLDGPIREAWIDVDHREGSVLRGCMHALARTISLGLQAGVPVGTFVRALRGTDGGPGGAVEDCEGVTEASSVPDLVGRILEREARGG